MNLTDIRNRLAEEFDKKNDGYNDDYWCVTSFKSGFDAAIEALSKLGPEILDKVDRALEVAVIDWLQWGDEFDSDKAQLALTMIHKRKEACSQLAAVIAAKDAEIQRLKDGINFATGDGWNELPKARIRIAELEAALKSIEAEGKSKDE